MISPVENRRPGKLEFAPIPLNQYTRTVKEEFASKKFTKADLLRIQRDMEIIRAFEERLAAHVPPPRPAAGAPGKKERRRGL